MVQVDDIHQTATQVPGGDELKGFPSCLPKWSRTKLKEALRRMAVNQNPTVTETEI